MDKKTDELPTPHDFTYGECSDYTLGMNSGDNPEVWTTTYEGFRDD